MLIMYFFIFLLSVVLFFIMAKLNIYLKLGISMAFFIIASFLFTLFIFKKAATPLPGGKFTLEQWKQRNANVEDKAKK
jgi:hypothetical protein